MLHFAELTTPYTKSKIDCRCLDVKRLTLFQSAQGVRSVEKIKPGLHEYWLNDEDPDF